MSCVSDDSRSVSFNHSYSLPGDYPVNVSASNLHSFAPFGVVGFVNNATLIVHVQTAVQNWTAAANSFWIKQSQTRKKPCAH